MVDFGLEEPHETVLEPVPIPPVTVKPVRTDEVSGTFMVEPLERGYGITLGTPLRRILLSSIKGTAVTWLRIEGVQHEYSTIPHVKEDVVEILLNVKGLHLRSLSDRPGRLRLEVRGEGRVCAGDIMTSPDFEIVNPELHLATLDDSGARLVMEMNVEQGQGYVPASQEDGLAIGVLPVDAVFSPVRKVNYWVEQTRVGQKTDFERLMLEVSTNGSLPPLDAVREAGQILVEHFFRFSMLTVATAQDGGQPSWALAIPPAQYNNAVENLNLSPRTLNCLKRAGIHKVGEILEKSRSELLRIRNFGEKSLEELDEKLAEQGLRHPETQAQEAAEAAQAEVESEEQPELSEVGQDQEE